MPEKMTLKLIQYTKCYQYTLQTNKTDIKRHSISLESFKWISVQKRDRSTWCFSRNTIFLCMSVLLLWHINNNASCFFNTHISTSISTCTLKLQMYTQCRWISPALSIKATIFKSNFTDAMFHLHTLGLLQHEWLSATQDDFFNVHCAENYKKCWSPCIVIFCY